MEATFAVIGGGISGLAAAHALATAGHRVELIEAEPTLGGRIASGVFRGRAVEFGGKNIGRRYARLRELVARCGGGDYELFGINTSRPHAGQIVTLDSASRVRSTARYLRGAPARDLARLARHAIRVLVSDDNRFVTSPYFSALAARDDEPLDAHFSPGFAATVVRPMTVRMNGAEPDEAYIGNFGTNLGMWLDRFEQLTAGLGPVVARIAAALPAVCHRRVVAIERDRGGALVVTFEDGGARRYRGAVLAVPAGAGSRIVRPLSAAVSDRLAEVRYHPVTVVLAEYTRPIFSPQRRAYVFEPDQPLSNAGAYGIGDLQLVRYTFSGRAARAWMTGASDDQLIATAELLLSRHVRVDASCRIDFAVRRFDPGLCAYSRDHARRLAAVRGALASHRIAVAGDYVQGASLEACVRSGARAAAAVTEPSIRTPSSEELHAHV